MFKTAVIWGVSGQDGSYLAELLLSKGYHVIGVSRRVSVPTDERIRHLRGNTSFQLVEGDVTDAGCVARILAQATDRLEVYNLAAQSHVATSFEQPTLTTNSTYLGCLNILEAIRNDTWLRRWARFYQASSSEMFGSCRSVRTRVTSELPQSQGDVIARRLLDGRHEVTEEYQDEHTPYFPCSPYAVAKLAAHHLVGVYRASYGLHASSGILFNHESERRGENFVTRKITKYVAAWKKRLMPKLKLGNLHAKRDWGHAEDYVRAMWLMLQQPAADDYVIATGETHTVEEFLLEAFRAAGCEATSAAELPVEVDPSLLRPCEVPFLRGCADKAKEKLGWAPTVTFGELARRMVYADLGGAE